MRKGLVTPHGSPKLNAKRELDFSHEEVETPTCTKRKAQCKRTKASCLTLRFWDLKLEIRTEMHTGKAASSEGPSTQSAIHSIYPHYQEIV